MRDLTGQKFGRLTAIKFIKKINRKYYWLFKCDCGTEKIMDKRIVAPPSSTTKSCGCLASEKARKRFTENNPNKSHGMSNTRFNRIWRAMKGRCRNKNHSGYYKYGARGVKICDRWLKFENFRDDMYKSYLEHCKECGEKDTTIDRINNNKGYSKSNCRWATIKEQANNKKNIRLFLHNGKYITIEQLAKELNTTKSAITNRIYKLNWDYKQIIKYYERL